MSAPITVNSFAETLQEVLEESPQTQKAIALATGIPEPHLSGMKRGERRCTPEYDLRIKSRFLAQECRIEKETTRREAWETHEILR